MGYSLCKQDGDFQNASFLKYLVFSGAVCFAERLKMICRIYLDVFENFNF